MDFQSVITSRRSARGFLNKTVPKDVLHEIMDTARWAPSSMNTQPWNAYILSGEPLEKIRKGNTENMLAGVPTKCDFETNVAYDGVYRKRQVDIAIQLFQAMGIARDDKEMRQDWVMRGFRQFDAPVSIVLTYERVLEPATIAQFDLGAFAHAILLAAWDRGLGCVINSQGIMQSPIVREHAGIPDSEAIMICIAMGYPDPDFSANAVRSTREEVESFAHFVGFD